jgi:hypothetical protein
MLNVRLTEEDKEKNIKPSIELLRVIADIAEKHAGKNVLVLRVLIDEMTMTTVSGILNKLVDVMNEASKEVENG